MKDKKKPLIDSLSSLAIPAIVSGGILSYVLGGMNKMFGLGDEKTPQKLAEEMMAGAVRGILEHFEYKLDDLKRDAERKDEEIGKLKEEVRRYEELEEKKKSSKTQKTK
jgi:hypothetical protein